MARGLILFFVIILLLSSLIKTILEVKTFNLFFIKDISINPNIILPVAIILSWLGLKLISAACMIGIGILAIFNIANLSDAMGTIYGPAYIICAFMGILLYLSIEPVLLEALPHMKRSANCGLNYIRNDCVEAEKVAQNLTHAMAVHKKEKLSEKSN